MNQITWKSIAGVVIFLILAFMSLIIVFGAGTVHIRQNTFQKDDAEDILDHVARLPDEQAIQAAVKKGVEEGISAGLQPAMAGINQATEMISAQSTAIRESNQLVITEVQSSNAEVKKGIDATNARLAALETKSAAPQSVNVNISGLEKTVKLLAEEQSVMKTEVRKIGQQQETILSLLQKQGSVRVPVVTVTSQTSEGPIVRNASEPIDATLLQKLREVEREYPTATIRIVGYQTPGTTVNDGLGKAERAKQQLQNAGIKVKIYTEMEPPISQPYDLEFFIVRPGAPVATTTTVSTQPSTQVTQNVEHMNVAKMNVDTMEEGGVEKAPEKPLQKAPSKLKERRSSGGKLLPRNYHTPRRLQKN